MRDKCERNCDEERGLFQEGRGGVEEQGARWREGGGEVREEVEGGEFRLGFGGRDVMKPRRECVLCSGSTSDDVFLPPPAAHISPLPLLKPWREHMQPAIVSYQGLSFTLIKAFSR